MLGASSSYKPWARRNGRKRRISSANSASALVENSSRWPGPRPKPSSHGSRLKCLKKYQWTVRTTSRVALMTANPGKAETTLTTSSVSMAQKRKRTLPTFSVKWPALVWSLTQSDSRTSTTFIHRTSLEASKRRVIRNTGTKVRLSLTLSRKKQPTQILNLSIPTQWLTKTQCSRTRLTDMRRWRSKQVCRTRCKTVSERASSRWMSMTVNTRPQDLRDLRSRNPRWKGGEACSLTLQREACMTSQTKNDDCLPN